MRLEPTEGVIMVGDEWWHSELGIRIPAPPLVVGDSSSSAERASAGRAVEAGMASTEPTGNGSGRFALELVRTLAMPVGWGRGAFATARFLASTHPVCCISAVIIPPVAWMLQAPVLWWAAICLVIAGVSTLVHEVGHLVALRMVAGRASPALLLATPVSARLIWRSTGPSTDIIVIIAGPLAPLVVAIAFAGPLLDAPIAGIGTIIVVLSHALTLTLRSGDGAELRAAVRRLKRVLPADRD